MITEAAVEAAVTAAWIEADLPNVVTKDIARKMIQAAAPHMARHVLMDAVEAFPLETITAPDNAVVWLMRRAGESGRP